MATIGMDDDERAEAAALVEYLAQDTGAGTNFTERETLRKLAVALRGRNENEQQDADEMVTKEMIEISQRVNDMGEKITMTLDKANALALADGIYRHLGMAHWRPIFPLWGEPPKQIPAHWHDDDGDVRIGEKNGTEETVLGIEADGVLSMQAIESDLSILVHLPKRVRLCEYVEPDERDVLMEVEVGDDPEEGAENGHE